MTALNGFLILVLIFSGCASGNTNKKDLSGVHPSSEEMAIGEKIHAQILSSFYPYTDPKVVGYINQIGNALAARADRKNLSYQFTLLYSDKIYATSAPGGHVYLTTGLIHFLDNEAELAAVLAHEIGELQFQDPRLSSSKKILEALTRGGSMVAPAFGEIGVLAVLGLAMVNAVSESRVLTPAERLHGADVHALHYMVDSGYDPQGLIDLLYRFLNADQAMTPFFYDYYQSRPITELRFLNVQAEFSKLPLQDKSFSVNREVYQETVKGIHEIYKH